MMDEASRSLSQPAKRPWRSWWIWLVGVLLFAGVLGLTMAKDLYLTGEQPNVWFYVLVPPVSLLGDTLGGFGVTRIFKRDVPFAALLAVFLISNLIAQVFENVLKLTWYLVWAYPGWLYLLFLPVLGLLLPAYFLVRWTELRWPLALGAALGGIAGGLVLTLVFTSVTGISTPGS